jgi:baseplate J-like protein|nr:MAG TPA: Baseplate J like protein [Caudoviricetes sp.]
MYEDKTYNKIMDEMMADFGTDVRTDEGSLAFNACAKVAEKLEDVYGDLDELDKNMYPDTQDLPHLIRNSKGKIDYLYAYPAIVKGVFKQDIEIGEQFICGDYTYTVSEKIEEHTYKLICDTEGAEANTNKGELIPANYIDDYKGGEITEILVFGADDEEEETFRKRLLDTFGNVHFGGNKADYRKLLNERKEVGGCKPKRREEGSPWIDIVVISDSFTTPSAEVLKELQNYVDPETSHGEGDGIAPCCHNVLIKAAESIKINVTAKLVFEGGYSVETSKSHIEEAIDKYLGELRKGWEANEFNDMTVRLSRIEANILNIQGVLDVENTSLNGVQGNVTLSYEKIPVRGEVVINV